MSNVPVALRAPKCWVAAELRSYAFGLLRLSYGHFQHFPYSQFVIIWWVKLLVCLIKHHNMKVYVGEEIKLGTNTSDELRTPAALLPGKRALRVH